VSQSTAPAPRGRTRPHPSLAESWRPFARLPEPRKTSLSAARRGDGYPWPVTRLITPCGLVGRSHHGSQIRAAHARQINNNSTQKRGMSIRVFLPLASVHIKFPSLFLTCFCLLIAVVPIAQLSLPSLRGRQIKTSCGWESKSRDGSFHSWINAWVCTVQVN